MNKIHFKNKLDGFLGLFDGGSKSSVKTDVITSNVVNALAENITNCRSNTEVTQSFIISGDYNVVKGAKQVQYVKLSAQCAQDVKNLADIQQSVANAIKSAANSQSVALIGALGKSESDIDTFIKNDVEQNITQRTIADIVNDSNATQEFIISGNNNIVKKFSQQQTFDIVYKNSQNAVSQLRSVQIIKNAASSDASATQEDPISNAITAAGDIATGIVSAYGTFGVIMILIFVCAGGFLIFVIIKGLSGGFRRNKGVDINKAKIDL